MTDDIEARLAALAGLARERELLARRGIELDHRLTTHQAVVADLHTRYAVEAHDVERLEGLSLARVLVALRGSHAEDLSREHAEAEIARYRLAEAEGLLAAIRAERQAVADRLTALADVPARFAAVLDEKAAALIGQPAGPQVERLLILAEERGRVEAELRELAEAGGAAEVALRALGEVRRQLDLALRRQSDDNWLGGALLAGEPHWLDGVAWASAHADHCLAVLHTELADVGLARPLGHAAAVVEPTGFADVMFGRMIIKDQLNHARRAVDGSAHLVSGVRHEVAGRTDTARAHWNTIMRERQKLLTH